VCASYDDLEDLADDQQAYFEVLTIG